MSRVIMFTFCGRRANMALQLPQYQRIIERNPNVEIHLWNLARDPLDDRWLRALPEMERITVRHDFFDGPKSWRQFNEVYMHYSAAKYRDCLFIKLDDDVVFMESNRIPEFVQAIKDNPEHVISALVINNGACVRHVPDLWDAFGNLSRARNLPLLDVHLKFQFANMCHRYFFDHWESLTGQEPELVDTIDWLSINFIGYNWLNASRIAANVGGVSPYEIAGRHFGANGILGDEGMVNTLPRKISHGMTVAHLYFGPQLKQEGETTFRYFRKCYADMIEKYLAT